MPIRINLLAETQAQEELRRRDPVKRAAWIGGGLVCVMAAWSISLQLNALMSKRELNGIQAKLAARSKEFKSVMENQATLGEMNRKLQALQQLASNRLLYGSLLNAFQQSTLDDVQLTRFRADQTYQFFEEVKAKTNSDDHVTAGKPAYSTEKVVLTLEARDSGPNPGDLVNKFKQTTFIDNPYFKNVPIRTNDVKLSSLSPPQTADNKSFVMFTLECRYPEKTR
jgi:hypothetical protein